MAQGRLESVTPFDSSELHSASYTDADFLSQEAVIYPKTFEDISEMLRRRDGWLRTSSMLRADKNAAADREARRYEYQARLKVYSDIGWHDRISGGSQEVYEELLEYFYRARLDVKRPQGLLAHKGTVDRLALGEMLIRHKLIKSLAGEGLTLRHATDAENDAGADIAIPLSASGESCIKVSIQPGAGNNADILPVQASEKSLLLHIPLRYGTDLNPLSQDDISILAAALETTYMDKSASGVQAMASDSLKY